MIFRIFKNLIGNLKVIENDNKTDSKNINKKINYYQWNVFYINYYINLYKKYNNGLKNIISKFQSFEL